ncbi:indoleamine -dioxygenase [Colletotrichum incanum]|uniref:Indoleamine-dioxygenase n=1 Tax=Colletotrichum incanum TaxID=1573173 RepID=A0A166P794_COLIC|nr:indoleamine -dioxygenase [Colletotrichum incanum]OHW89536.1 indoleamine-dioxygenase [Colletotrichum incanum]
MSSLQALSAISPLSLPFQQHGFLPPDLPCKQLSDPIYQPWEQLISQLPRLNKSSEIQTRINELPTLGTKGLHGKAEWRRAYVILCFLAHGYIWASNPPAEVLPPTITLPLLAISDFLEVPPVATYAALTLWNCRSSKTDKVQLEGLTVEHTFTGTDDEAWFYLVSVAMEAQGGRIISVATSALSHMLERDYTAAMALLHSLAAEIDNLGNILGRLHENCNPDVFFHKIRPFLQGGQESAGFSNGIFYDEGSGKGSWRQLKGGSNGQSSLFHFLDIVLGVQHVPIQTKASKDFRDEASKCFFREMREYMPGSHRRFLSLFSDLPNLRDLVALSRGNEHHQELWEAYRQATRSLTGLRTKHLSIVARYIILPSRPTSQQPNNQEELYGTGATLLIPFLKQARDETNQAGESQP